MAKYDAIFEGRIPRALRSKMAQVSAEPANLVAERGKNVFECLVNESISLCHRFAGYLRNQLDSAKSLFH